MRRVKSIAGHALAVAIMVVTPAAVAHADDFQQFQSPSGNIFCNMPAFSGMSPEAVCEIVDRTWSPPPRSQDCVGEWGDRVTLVQGGWPAFTCHTDTTRDPRLPVLAYGESRSVANLTCASAPDGVTCTDTGTGHFFRISRESFELY